jgi:CMP-N-acetylneuraminic acid synthetase
VKTKKKIVAIVPARGGSVGIKNKNIVNLNGKPLIHYTAAAIQKSKYISSAFISTDSKQIAKIAESEGLTNLGLRPKYLSQKYSKTIDTIIYMKKIIEKKLNYIPDIFVTLQPTSPLRTSKDLDKAIELFIRKKPDSVVSVIETPHSFNPFSQMKLNNNLYLEGALKEISKQKSLRQDKQKFYSRNGAAIYITSRNCIIKKKSLFGNKVLPYIMNKLTSIDIDDYDDLYIASSLLKNMSKN